MDFAVLMSCYKNDNPIFLKEAIESSYTNQTLKPNAFYIMVDGPVGSNIEDVLSFYENKYPGIFIVNRLPVNKGLGNALRVGVELSKFEYIVRMDSDDISKETRFEKLIECAENNPEYAIIGSYTAEFESNPNDIMSVRTLKSTQHEIFAQSKKRSPVSHVSVVLKRSAVLDSGNYMDFLLYEDYYLWVRMLQKGYKFYNISEILVFVRTDKDRYKRKGSKLYIDSTKKFQSYLLESGYINKGEYMRNSYGRILVAIIPSGFRKIIYEKILRVHPQKFNFNKT
ncbi:MAG: hypothetical protein JL56_15715 [Desulfotomaculum sp. BICA1-6]|nr:MAG: hypothetical protein JL56_15715 [Desulfotomaculum sp. BICA1-6]